MVMYRYEDYSPPFFPINGERFYRTYGVKENEDKQVVFITYRNLDGSKEYCYIEGDDEYECLDELKYQLEKVGIPIDYD